MGLINLSLPSDGETGSVAKYNAALTSIQTLVNGNLDYKNLANNTVTNSKLASNAGTSTKFAPNSITAPKIDWASTGANAGIWWEELGRTVLTEEADLMDVTIPVRKYLKVILIGIPSGVLDLGMTFNSDSTANYARRQSSNGGAEGTSTTTTGAPVGPDTVNAVKHSIFYIVNVANQEKVVLGEYASGSASGAGTAPARRLQVFKWYNTTDNITSINISNVGSGNMAAGSTIIVLGHN